MVAGLLDGVWSALFFPVLPPSVPALFSVMFFSALVVLLITVFNKVLVDQEKIRNMRDEVKNIQKKAKEVQKENPEEANKLLNESLKLTNKQMSMNMRAMIPTLVFVMLLLPWMAGTFMPSVPLSSNSSYEAVFESAMYGEGAVLVSLKNVTRAGDVSCFMFVFCSQKDTFLYSFDLDGDGEFEYADLSVGDSIQLENKWIVNGVVEYEQDGEKKYLLGMGLVIVSLPFVLPFFSYGFGWLMWYIITSIPFSILFRKALGVV